MKRCIPFTTFLAALTLGISIAFGQGASPRRGTVIIPDSNIQRPGDIGVRSHTNYLIFVPAATSGPDSPQGETPGSIACIYGLVANTTGCPVATATTVPTGGNGTIAVVDAFDYPTAESDFNFFSDYFGLPHGDTACNGGPCFRKAYVTGSAPRKNAGWALEAALDIEWAHAMAPSAQIVLVEAASNSLGDLLDAVDVASNEVLCGDTTCPSGGTGTGVVSMSWGGSEFSQEINYDSYFDHAGIVYTAASGDAGGVPNWPSSSPNVLSAGGTTIHRASDGTFSGETAWSDSGGGLSAFEGRPTFQDVITGIVGEFRGTPDVSFDSDPASGVSVYDSTPYHGYTGWLVIGGTSAATQALAGIINLVGTAASSTQNELTAIYNTYGNATNYPLDFTDITDGQTSACNVNPHRPDAIYCQEAGSGWDFVTGVGTNLGTSGK